MKRTVQRDGSNDGMAEISPLESVLARLSQLHLALQHEFKALHAELEAAAKSERGN